MTASNPRIIIISGFLGSGKTSLLRYALAHGLGGPRTALIVNEFGALGFDGSLLRHDNATIPLVELSNGCICCVAGSDLLVAVEELLWHGEPELIIIETSGLASPAPLIARLQSAQLPIEAVVTVADAAHLPASFTLDDLQTVQLRFADLIVLNKIDLVAGSALPALQAQIAALNPRAILLTAINGECDLAGLWRAEDRQGGPRPMFLQPDAPHGAALMQSLVWRDDHPLDRAALLKIIATIMPPVYRLKGIVHVVDQPWALAVNAVAGRVTCESIRLAEAPTQLNQLVLIGPDLAAQDNDLLSLLNESWAEPERQATWLSRRA